MKIRIVFVIILLYQDFSCYPAEERVPVGARATAMGGASVVLLDVWSAFNNQAGTAFLEHPSLGFYYENHFLIKELQKEGLAFAWPTRLGSFTIILHHTGNNLYNEIKSGFCYSRKFGKNFAAGIQLDYGRIHIEDGGNKNLISCEIGLLYRATKQLSIGLHVVNPVPIKLSSQPTELLPTTICLGAGFQFSASFLATLEIEKDLIHSPAFRGGIEYHFARSFSVRLGLSTQPVNFSFGFGLEFGQFKIDLASTYHQVLGFSPSGSLTYSFR